MYKMTLNSLEEISLERMSTALHASFIRTQYDLAKSDSHIMSIAASFVEALGEACLMEESHYKLDQKSTLSDVIKDADKYQDYYYNHYKRTVKNLTLHPDKAKKDAACLLLQNLSEYRIKPRGSRLKQTESMCLLVAELKAKYSEQIALLGLESIVDGMDEYNKLVYSTTAARTSVWKDRVVGISKYARTQSNIAFRSLQAFVSAYALLNDDGNLKDYILSSNSIVKQYRLAMGVSAKTPEKEVTQQPDNQNSGSNSQDPGTETPTDQTPSTGSGTDQNQGGSNPPTGSGSGNGTVDDNPFHP